MLPRQHRRAPFGLKPVLRRVWAPKGERPIALGHHRYKWLYGLHPAPIRRDGLVSRERCLQGVLCLSAVLLRRGETGAGRERIIVLALDNAGWHTEPNL